MEEKIIRTLDYSLRFVSPVHFLERYLRLLGADEEKKNKISKQISNLAR